MRDLVEREMKGGALGIASALIYAPGFYATTDELIELSKVAAKHHGIYISHMRSEGNRLIEAVDELIRIAARQACPREIYHLKAAGQANWPKMDRVIADGGSRAQERPEDHRGHVHVHRRRRPGSMPRCRRGCRTAATTHCSSACAIRGSARRSPRRCARRATNGKICICAAGSADRVLLVEFKIGRAEAADRQDARRGRAAARQVARRDHHGPRDRGPVAVGTIYFLMSDENLKKEIKLPWVSFGVGRRVDRRRRACS